MFVEKVMPNEHSEPQRGDMFLGGGICAAPPGLGIIETGGGCYKHGAPLELTSLAKRSLPSRDAGLQEHLAHQRHKMKHPR